jgi:VWFA-related protein
MNRIAKAFSLLSGQALLLVCLAQPFWNFGLAQTSAGLPRPEPVVTSASGQTQMPADQSSYKLTIHSDIVLLDVVVRDAKGKLVTGLSRDDFSIEESGISQKINSFEATVPLSNTGSRISRIDTTEELDRSEPEAPVTIVVLDELTTRFEDEYFARYSLQKYLGTQGEVLNQPVMLIARSIDRTMVLCDYTTSKKKVLEALNRHLAGNDWRNQNPNFSREQVGAAFASLIEVAKATQGHPGHKNVVWIGRGFTALQWGNLPQDQIDAVQGMVAKCVELLREARVTLYAIDPAGVTVDDGRIDQNGVVTIDDPFNGAVNFDSMVRATGGQSMHGRNDVDRLVGDAVASGETFYTLSYRPSWLDGDDSGKFRPIKVIVRGGGLTATSRLGYYPGVAAGSSFPDAQAKAGSAETFDLASACSGLMVFDGVPLTVSRQDPASGQIQISFPASAVGLDLNGGKMKGDVTLITLGYDRTGKLLAKDGRVVSLHLSPLPPGHAEDRKVQIATALNPQLPIARVRLVIRSNSNGKIGADNLFLVDPRTLKDPATGLKIQK